MSVFDTILGMSRSIFCSHSGVGVIVLRNVKAPNTGEEMAQRGGSDACYTQDRATRHFLARMSRSIFGFRAFWLWNLHGWDRYSRGAGLNLQGFAQYSRL